LYRFALYENYANRVQNICHHNLLQIVEDNRYLPVFQKGILLNLYTETPIPEGFRDVITEILTKNIYAGEYQSV